MVKAGKRRLEAVRGCKRCFGMVRDGKRWLEVVRVVEANSAEALSKKIKTKYPHFTLG